MKENLIHLNTQRASIPMRILYLIFFLTSVLVLFFPINENSNAFFTITGIIFSIAGTLRSDLYYNHEKKLLLTFYRVYGLRIYTQTEKLPELKYIAIVSVVERQRVSSRTNSRSFAGQKFNLNLIYKTKQNKPFKTLETGNYEAIVEIATILSKAIDKRIFVTIGKQRSWLN